jgi:hypothetical protein
MALTLRQIISSVALFSGRARDKKSASMLGYLFSREMQRAGLAEPGRAGHRGAKSPPATSEQAALALLSIPSGSAPREAIAEAEILAGLVFEGGTRTFIATAGSCALPLALDGAERLEGLRFGDLLERLLIAFRIGPGPEHFYTDRWTAPFGLRCGQGEAGAVATYERFSPAPNQDGHFIYDRLVFGRSYALPPRGDAAQRSIFLPIALVRRIGEALGPVAGISADELQQLGTQRPTAAVGFGGVTRLILESKEDIKKRGAPSPDEWDAVALTFAEPVVSDTWSKPLDYSKVNFAVADTMGSLARLRQQRERRIV